MDQYANTLADGNLTQSPRSWLAQNAPAIAVVLLCVAAMAYKGVDVAVVGLVALGLGMVIFIHELGHFLAAKWCDVHVEAFAIGFGPSLPGCEYKWGETTYRIGLIPLGGYVKMVGEGTDSEEGEDDPRSFKNKSVGQRMVIISAGVIMNIILAAVGFVSIYMTHGAERLAGVIGQTDAGSPAWQLGLRSGAELKRIANIDNPYFDDVRPAVVLSGAGEKVPVVYQLPGQSVVIESAIEPKFDKEVSGLRLIGVAPGNTTIVRGSPRMKIPPFVPGSSASQAEPAVLSGDRIVASSDPSKPGNAVSPLPADPRLHANDQRDFNELYRRMVDLAGQPMTLQVERKGASKPIDVSVPAAYMRNFGLLMRMGQVVGVRDGSPAARAGVQPRTSEPGDIIKQVELEKPGGGVIRLASTHSDNVPEGVEERVLDPLRLPFELAKWAETAKSPKKVKMTVLRRAGHAQLKSDELTAEWDDGWKYARETPFSVRSPLAIPGLGLAFYVETVIDEVIPGSAAAKAGLKPGDIIKEAQYYRGTAEKPEPFAKWVDLKSDQWAHVFWRMHEEMNPTRIDLRVQRDEKQIVEVGLELPVDTTWPVASRGFVFDEDTRIQKADTPLQALGMGAKRVTDTAGHIYMSLKSMFEGNISFNKNANGPISIAISSYNIAGDNLPKFILFLSILSVNLAVINFLPIPVLDGGHMVFLIYERLRGKPAPESVRVAATFAGVALICSLMLYVIVLDVVKHVL